MDVHLFAISCMKCHFEIIKYICYRSFFEIIKYMMDDSRVDVNISGETPFYIASSGCQFQNNQYCFEIIKYMMNDERINLNKDNNYEEKPFIQCVKKSYFERIKYMMNYQRINVNKENEN